MESIIELPIPSTNYSLFKENDLDYGAVRYANNSNKVFDFDNHKDQYDTIA